MSDINVGQPIRTLIPGDVSVAIVDSTSLVELRLTDQGDMNVFEANSGDIKTAVETVAGAVSGNEMQVAGSVTVSGSVTVDSGSITETNSGAILTAVEELATIVDGTSVNVIGFVEVTNNVDTTITNTELNPVPVYLTEAISGQEVVDFKTTAAVASQGTTNHDFDLTAGKVFRGSVVEIAASGLIKVEIRMGALANIGDAASLKMVAFNSVSFPTLELNISKFELADTGTQLVRIIIKNLDKKAQDVYSTLQGSQVTP